ncbi:unnamed protein product [Urochloa decumbens]|uniref:cAMP-regulated phosphoprotein 19-related protein n=1 Tax=Urochloa decumbens TaxID=240449 RepID=A0ABC9FAG4_9POAL
MHCSESWPLPSRCCGFYKYVCVASHANSTNHNSFRFLAYRYTLCRGAGRSRMAESSATMGEEAFVEKKYGGMTPKKPLISKDQERAYFDSADWVLGKQAANSSGARAAAIESLKPKLKRTPHPQLPPRKPTCASS